MFVNLDAPATIGDVWAIGLLCALTAGALAVMVSEIIDWTQEATGHTAKKLDDYARRAWNRRRKP